MLNSYQFAWRTVWNVGWRYLLRHRWQTGLMVLGITLGVAVVVAIDLANASASRAFELSSKSVAGQATHQIVGGSDGLDEKVYVALRRAGILNKATPVISTYASSPQLGNAVMQLLGVDLYTDSPFRNYLGSAQSGGLAPARAGNLTAFLTQPGAIAISKELADRFGLKACVSMQDGCSLTLTMDGHAHPVFIAGLIYPGNQTSSPALQNLILTDIATAQELTGRIGKIDWIDLILADKCVPSNQNQAGSGDECPEAIAAHLPSNAHLQTVGTRNGAVAQMIAAFQLNLTALSLLALVVGLFLIYNTMTFSVVQRRVMYGTLRCLGVTRQEVFVLVLSEAFLVSVLGTALGLALGILLGQGAVRLVTRTINDLFFVITVQGIQIPPISLVKGTVLGILATLGAAIPPAWEASSVPPRFALSRSGLETKARRAITMAALFGTLLFFLGAGLLLIPTRSLVLSFGGTFLVIVGFALLAPIVTIGLMRLASPVFARVWGSLGRMASRDVVSSISRTSVAIASLMVAVSVTIGVSLMVSSFRYTVVTWLSQTLSGDIYISAPSLQANQSSSPIDARVIQKINDWPNVSRVFMLRSVDVNSPAGPIRIAASNNPDVTKERTYLSAVSSADSIQTGVYNGGVIISEPLANRLQITKAGGVLTLFTNAGAKNFPILGIYYDYSSTEGIALMSLDVYRTDWHDQTITAIALQTDSGANNENTTVGLQTALSPIQSLLIRPNQVLRAQVLSVFDRTFAITGALQLLATIIAFIGILSALLSIELERFHELGILRAIGLTIGQLWKLLLIETGLMGATAGILAMPTGYVLAIILVYIINLRSFGWTLQMQVLPEPFIQALGVAVVAAELAGIYPAYRLGKIVTSDALHQE